MRTLLILFLLLPIVRAQAAPIPGTSSSLLIGNDLGWFRSAHGFAIHAGNTQWILSPPPKDIPALTTFYHSPKTNQGSQASLTVRVDQLSTPTSLKSYVKKWVKDYPRLGFELLISKPIKVGNHQAFLIDVLNKASEKQLRQVLFMKDRTAVVLTCRDNRAVFDDTLKDCNEIIRHFQWTK